MGRSSTTLPKVVAGRGQATRTPRRPGAGDLTGSTHVITTDRPTRGFGTGRVLDALTLEVPRGAIFGFFGPNGAGKTTTIGLLLGPLGPTRGSAQVLGLDPWRRGDEARRLSGAVLHDTGVHEFLSAEENLELRGRIARLPGAERRRRTRDLLESAGLWDRRHEKAGAWTGGMQRRLALAGAPTTPIAPFHLGNRRRCPPWRTSAKHPWSD